MFAKSKNKKMLTISICIALIIAITSLSIAWNKNKYDTTSNISGNPDFSYYPFLILNITGDRCKDGIEGNITDSIQVLEITVALNTKNWFEEGYEKYSKYEKLEINFSSDFLQSNLHNGFGSNKGMIIMTNQHLFSHISESFTYEKFIGTPGIWNNTTQSWDKEPIGNYTTVIEKIDYGTELNPKNAGLFNSRFFFAYSIRDKDNSFDNGNRIYDKDDRYIINNDDIIKIIINIGNSSLKDNNIELKNNTRFLIEIPGVYNVKIENKNFYINPKYYLDIEFKEDRYVYPKISTPFIDIMDIPFKRNFTL